MKSETATPPTTGPNEDGARRLDALEETLGRTDLDEAKRLIAEFRPADRELVVGFARAKLDGDEGGAAWWRNHLEDSWALESLDAEAIQLAERRSGRQFISGVTAVHPPTRLRAPGTGLRYRTTALRQPAARARERRDTSRRSARRSASRGGDSGDDPGEPEPPRRRRLCAHCGRDIPAEVATQARYCSTRHADADRQRRKRARDRERDVTPRVPTAVDYRRMLELDRPERARLLACATCRCNGHHILEQDPELGDRCVKCGRQMPPEFTLVRQSFVRLEQVAA